MSKRNGDKARYAKQRHAKMIRRKRLRESMAKLGQEKKPATAQAEPTRRRPLFALRPQ